MSVIYKVTYPYGRVAKEFKSKKTAMNYILKYKLPYAEIHKIKIIE